MTVWVLVQFLPIEEECCSRWECSGQGLAKHAIAIAGQGSSYPCQAPPHSTPHIFSLEEWMLWKGDTEKRCRKQCFTLPFWALGWDFCNKRHINKRKTNRSVLTISQGKWVTSQGDLEFRIKYHLNREKEERGQPLWGEKMTFREDEWVLRVDGRYMTSCDKVCLGMVLTLVSPKSQTSLVEETPGGRGLMAHEFLWKDLSSHRGREFRESLSLYLLFFKCLQLKIISSKVTYFGVACPGPLQLIFWGSIFCSPS